jgi:hypothetical protein
MKKRIKALKVKKEIQKKEAEEIWERFVSFFLRYFGTN